jgi:hypothetical protein
LWNDSVEHQVICDDDYVGQLKNTGGLSVGTRIRMETCLVRLRTAGTPK